MGERVGSMFFQSPRTKQHQAVGVVAVSPRKQGRAWLFSSLLLAIAGLAAGSTVAIAQGAASVPAESKAHRDYGYIAMKDGVKLAYVVWRPTKEGRYPVLLRYTAYYESALTLAQVKEYVDAGYAVVGANIRGSGCSEGENFVPFLANEGPDGAQIVEWAGVQSWSTGNVGMIGQSYASDVQWLVGAEQPSHLKALSIAGSSASDYRDWLMLGGQFHQSMVGDWALLTQERMARVGAERRIKEWGDKKCVAILAKQKPHDFFYEAQQHPLQDEWWEAPGRGKERVATRITVPTMLTAGLQDDATNPAAAARGFAHLLPKVTHKRLVYTNGGHDASYTGPIVQETIRWMDRWVKGINNGVDKELPVKLFWESRIPGADFSDDYYVPVAQLARAVPGWTTTYANWPVPNLERTTFYLTNDAQLSLAQPTPSPDQGARSYLYPTGTELPGSNKSFALAPEPIGSLSYRTDPMTADMALLGNPEVTLYFSSEKIDTDFMVTLKDIGPEGNSLYLTRGFLRASMREIDPARTWPDEVNQSFRKVDELTPGKIYEARFSLWTVGHVVRQGHRLEMSILAPNDIPSRHQGATPVGGPSVNKVFHSAQYASRLILPIVPGEKAQAPAPACGVLWYQPCRKASSSVADWSGGFVRK